MAVGRIVYHAGGKRSFFIDDRKVSEAAYRKRFPSKLDLNTGEAPFVACASCWPMTSEALSCTEGQVEAMNARNAKHGISTRYDATGLAHVPTRGDRAKLLKLEGFHDVQGGYGD